MIDDELPKGWIRRRVGDVLRLQNGYPFKPTQWSETGFPIIRIQNLNSRSASYNHFSGELPEKFRARDGDLLFAWSGTPGTSFGAHVWLGGEAWINQHIFRVDFSADDYDRDFLRLALNANLNAYISDAQGGVGLAHITKAKLNESQLVSPPLATQRQLAQLVQRVDLTRDSSLSHLAAARRAIDRFRQAVLAAACSGRLTADWREAVSGDDEKAQQLVEQSISAGTRVRRNRMDEPWFEPDWIDLPTEWTWAPLRDLATIRGGIQKQPKRTPKANAYPYLRVANVLRGRVDVREMQYFELFNDELETYRLEPGDLLVVEGNGSATEIGRAAVWRGEIPNCVHQNHIIRVRCVAMNPQFVELFWNSPIGAREVAALAVTSAGLYSLSTKKIGAVPIPVAPLEEQAEIVRRASGLLAAADSLQHRVDRARIHVDRCSQAIVAKAFRGDLAVGTPEVTT